MTRFVGAEFQVNQICGEEQEDQENNSRILAE